MPEPTGHMGTQCTAGWKAPSLASSDGEEFEVMVAAGRGVEQNQRAHDDLTRHKRGNVHSATCDCVGGECGGPLDFILCASLDFDFRADNPPP